MSEHINTYSACDIHKNGHSEHCMGCEVDALRSLLREVASSDASAHEDDDGFFTVWVPEKLWRQIIPLRTPPVVKVNSNE